jgi:hypothetical protein
VGRFFLGHKSNNEAEFLFGQIGAVLEKKYEVLLVLVLFDGLNIIELVQFLHIPPHDQLPLLIQHDPYLADPSQLLNLEIPRNFLPSSRSTS